MAEAMHSFLEERLRLALTGSIPGQQLDHLVTTLATLFKSVRPTATPNEIFISISEPSICGYAYCSCNGALNRYEIIIFVDRRDQGRRVTKPWVRASSTDGFEEAVKRLMARADELVTEADSDMARVDDK